MSATSAGDAVLACTGVRKSFGGVRALRGVDLSVSPGSIHALVGENGAGKSTLIKVLTGVYSPDEGDVRLDGQAFSPTAPAQAQDAGISTIYQEVNLVPLLTVAQNICLGREPRHPWGTIDRRELHRRAQQLCDDLGVQVDVGRELGSLGLGTQQMVALARAVSLEAKVVIMDEPTSSLEAAEVQTLFDVARRLRDQGAGIVFVSHRLDELWQLCDQVTVLRDGSDVHHGPIADLDTVGLVSLMLGREVEDRHDTTEFSDHSSVESTEPVLTVEGLGVRQQLTDVSFDVRPGEVVGLAGLLGAGRSETVKTIYGAMTADSGTVTVGGRQVRHGSVRHALASGIALLSEDRKAEGVIPEMSVRDNIALAVLPSLSRFGVISDRKVDEVVDTFMRRLRIKASSPDQTVGSLSGGNQQKVLLARWLCTEPTVFLLDEPTRGIDVGAKAEVQALIDELAERGLSVVLISSEMEELVEGSDRIVVLRDGRVAARLRHDDVSNAALLQALAAETPGDNEAGDDE